MNQNKSSPKNSIDNLYDSFAEIALSDLDEAKLILKQKGIDSNVVVENGLLFINKLKAKAKINLAVSDGKQKLTKATILFRSTVQNLDHPKSVLAKVLQGNFPQLAVNFSKLETISIDEVEQMLTEAQILEIIEKIEKNEFK